MDHQHLISEYLAPSFSCLDQNQLFLGLAFGATLCLVALNRRERNWFWRKLLILQLVIVIPLLRVFGMGDYWDQIGFTAEKTYPVNWGVGAVIGLVAFLLIWRNIATSVDLVKFIFTKKTKISRRQNTDIKKLLNAKKFWLFPYRVPHFQYGPDRTVLGRYSNLRLCSVKRKNLSNENILIRGASGYGKSALLQNLVKNYLDDTVFLFNPKIDDYLLRFVSWQFCKKGSPFFLIDLEGELPQFSLFENKGWRDIEKILISDPQFENINDASSYYTNFDRDMIYKFSRFFDGEKSLSANWKKFCSSHSSALKKSEKFFSFMTDLCRLPVSDAKPGTGLRFEEVVRRGGLVYFKCATRCPRTKRLQRLIVVVISQFIRAARNDERPYARLIFEEFKFFVNTEILDLFSIGRSDRIGVTVIHQSRADMIQNDLGFDPEAILGTIEENSDTQIIFRTNSVTTGRHAADQSGDSIAEEDTRFFEVNGTLSELKSSSRSCREVIKAHATRNEFMSLRRFEAFVFGLTEARLFRFAPIRIPSKVLTPVPSLFPSASSEYCKQIDTQDGGPIDVGE